MEKQQIQKMKTSFDDIFHVTEDGIEWMVNSYIDRY